MAPTSTREGADKLEGAKDTGATRTGAAGRYAIFGEIASGGMATVHVGRLLGPGGFNRTVAIKRLHAHFAKDPEFVAMLLDEARLAARIRHPNVVPTLDVVVGDDEILLVMEYVSGETLSRLLRATSEQGRRLHPGLSCAILVGALHGLHAAHEAKNDFGEPLGIVHRDVSPQNIMVGIDGVPRVLDFGVAKAMGRLQQTRDSTLKGKAPYMAPEQIKGAAVTRKTDVFASAIVLWESLTMKRLFLGENEAVVMQKVLSMPIPKPSSIVPDLPSRLDEVVLRALDRDPQRRFGTARDMALALEDAVGLALPSQIGEWVEETAATALGSRARRVAEIESSSALERPEQIISTSEFIADVLWPGTGGKGRPVADDVTTNVYVPPSPEAPAPLPPVPARAIARSARPEAVPESERPLALARRPVAAASVETAVADADAARARLLGAARSALVASVVLVAIFGIVALVLPGYVRSRAIAMAAAQGLTLAIDDVSVGFGGARLTGVVVTSAEVPGMKATASELHVETAGFEPKLLTVRGAVLEIDGPIRDVVASADRWHASHQPSSGAPPAPAPGDWMKVSVPFVRVAWTHAFAGDGRIDVPDGAAEILPKASPRPGDEYHFTSEKVTVHAGAAVLGPWRIDLDREVNGARLRVALDPPVPDGPNLLFVHPTAGEETLDVNIQRSPVFRLGVPPALASMLPVAPQQVSAKIHYASLGDAHAEGTFEVTLFGVKLAPSPNPVDVKLSGGFAGDPRAPINLKDGALEAGPIQAAVAGTLSLADGPSVNLGWKANPVPCSKFVKSSSGINPADLAALGGALGGLGDLGGALGGGQDDSGAGMGAGLGGGLGDLGSLGMALGSMAGPSHVSGTLSASGTILLDARDPSKSSFATKVKNSCGLSLFATH